MISLTQILILIIGFVAISYALGSEVRFIEAGDAGDKKVNPQSPNPTHGYAGKAYEFIFGEGESAPAGKHPLYDKGTNKMIELETSGAGYSISGILEGASYAIVIWGGLYLTRAI